MPVIPTILAGATLANGLSAHFRDGYSMDGLQSEQLPNCMDLGLPSTAPVGESKQRSAVLKTTAAVFTRRGNWSEPPPAAIQLPFAESAMF